MESKNISDWLITLGLWETATFLTEHPTSSTLVLVNGDYYLKYHDYYVKV